MSEKFHPITMRQLSSWIFTELETQNSIFGIPRELFFIPRKDAPFQSSAYGHRLETPFGVAAGPHTQMAQNIVAAWLCGARFIELKTVQTLDEIEVSKPCIDLQDEGYNVEWSQELKVEQSFDEYLRAWVLIHALHRKLGFPGESPGVVFNMSVGYNLEGLLKPNMHDYFRRMRNASDPKNSYRDVVASFCPEVNDVLIPDGVSDNVTLSTMHGCPPDEIEKIAAYLMNEWNLHTGIKLNPTLLGSKALREILNEKLGYRETVVPDSAFDRDLKYADAVPMLRRLDVLARQKNLQFGVKLSNTLEVENFKDVLPANEKTMYMSGRALHAITVNLAARLDEEFEGELFMSFSAGADAFNAPRLLQGGMKTVTACSDILKTGGYLRLLQYVENMEQIMKDARAADLSDLICKTARRMEGYDQRFEEMLQDELKSWPDVTSRKAVCRNLTQRLIHGLGASRVSSIVRGWAGEQALTAKADDLIEHVVRVCARINLARYAAEVPADRTLAKHTYTRDRSKTPRPLGLFDCIQAPCTDRCAVSQQVPQYMSFVRQGKLVAAIAVTREDNPLPTILGRACNHLCENTCVRTHLDEPLAIREIKRFIMAQEKDRRVAAVKPTAGARIAVIGGGPCGLSVAYFLTQAGYPVTIFEARSYPGGMVSGTIPAYRAAQFAIDQDLKLIHDLGSEIHFNQKAGRDFTITSLKEQGFKYVVIAVGAQRGRRMDIPGDDAEGLFDALEFLRAVREGHPPVLGRKIGVIGGGDVAIDCARSAWRLTGQPVSIIYRRTIDQMPAAREEIEDALAEGIKVVELARPQRVISKKGKITGLECLRVKLGEKDDSGRRRPVDIPNSEFTIPLDTLIVAVSHEADLDFLPNTDAGFFGPGDGLKLERANGYIQVDPLTMETSVPGVFAGGDVSVDGPESIVKALGDGRKIAASIRRKEEGSSGEKRLTNADVNVVDLKRRRAHREFRVAVPHLPSTSRSNFEEVVLTLTEEEARKEAARCLDCHLMCSICEGVCPNLAIRTYRSKPLEVRLPEIKRDAGQLSWQVGRTFRVDQQFQVAVLTDFCNECGNCATFCPTSGRPYRDKPRLYLYAPDFEAEADNAFMIFDRDGSLGIRGRFGGETQELLVRGEEIIYSTPSLRAVLNSATFEPKELSASDAFADGTVRGIEAAAVMVVLLKGISESQPHMPTAEG